MPCPRRVLRWMCVTVSVAEVPTPAPAPAPTPARKFALGEGAGYPDGYANGFFATEPIVVGEDLLVVWPEDALTATTPFQLSAKVFCHNALGEASPWSKLISSTLGSPGHSLREELETSPELAGAPHLALAQIDWAKATSMCQSLVTEEGSESGDLLHAWRNAPRSKLALQMWLWAEHQVISRAFGNATVIKLLAEGSIFNHAGDPNIDRREDPDGTHSFISRFDIAVGEELLISYADATDRTKRTAFTWLQNYEFLPSELLEQCQTPGLCPELEALFAACEPEHSLRCMHAYAMLHDDRAFYTLCVALGEQGKPAEAEAACRSAIAIDPQHYDAYTDLGNALYEQGDFDGAVRAYRAAADINPRRKRAYTNLGEVLGRRGDVSGSVAAYRAAVAIDPKDDIAYFHIGSALGSKGDMEGAGEAFKAATAINPLNNKAHINLGVVHDKQGDFASAAADYRAAVEIDPEDSDSFLRLCTALYRQNLLEDAAQACRAAIDIDPRNRRAFQLLKMILAKQGEL